MTAAEIIKERISVSPDKMLPWRDVMGIALYEPNVGYYRQGVRRIGRGGDFFTSVSVGPLFGTLLAGYCHSIWNAMQRPESFSIIEQGAHDGTLTKDVSDALQRDHKDLYECAEHVIVEPDQLLRVAQQHTIGNATKLRHFNSWEEAASMPLQGVILCNELLDAFPVHRVTFEGGEWHECHVCWKDDRFEFTPGPLSSAALRSELQALGKDFPNGFICEVNLDMLAWVREIVGTQFKGTILVADYGHAVPEYIAPQRGYGTLRRYHKHQTDTQILDDLGECDLTAHVNFTRLAEEGQSLGMQVTDFIEQGRFLTRIASDLMKQPHFMPDAAWMRQFQTLTHPSHLGQAFQFMTLAKGQSGDTPSNFTQREAALRRLGIDCNSA